MVRFILFSFLTGLGQWLVAQGRIDTLSIENYRIKIVQLPEKLKEISTLEYDDGQFWGLNDSGGEAEIYKFHPETGKIIQTVSVSNAANHDWEEMASNEDYLFIGDFGNINGKRQDLAVYYFSKGQIGHEPESTVDALKIEFSYPEQKNFNPGNRATNFDCEAMFYHN